MVRQFLGFVVTDEDPVAWTAVGTIRDGGAIAVVRGWDDANASGRDITVHAVGVGLAMQNTDWPTKPPAANSNCASRRRYLPTRGRCRGLHAKGRRRTVGRLVIAFRRRAAGRVGWALLPEIA